MRLGASEYLSKHTDTHWCVLTHTLTHTHIKTHTHSGWRIDLVLMNPWGPPLIMAVWRNYSVGHQLYSMVPSNTRVSLQNPSFHNTYSTRWEDIIARLGIDAFFHSSLIRNISPRLLMEINRHLGYNKPLDFFTIIFTLNTMSSF